MFDRVKHAVRRVKRIVVLITGYTILAIGIALLVLPGPAFIVIPIGLGILATEVRWARALLDKFSGSFTKKRDAARARRTPPPTAG